MNFPSKSKLSGMLMLSICGTAHSINISNYSAEKNNLFASGFSSDSPIRNTASSFIGAGYDWTGLGWITDAQSGRVTSFTLVTPLHTLSAGHNPVTVLGTEARLVNSVGETVNITLRGTSNTPSGAGDLSLAPLKRAVTTSDQVTPLRLLDVSSGNYVGRSTFVAGSDNQTAGLQVATSTVTAHNSGMLTLSGAGSFLGWEGGDSGSPAFLPYAGKLTIAGTAWFPTTASGILPNGGYNPIPGLNSYLFWTGYALKWTIYDNPSDPSNTANVWSGLGGDGKLGNQANWSFSGSIAGRPAVFDSALSPAQHSPTLAGDLLLRGILFRSSTDSVGFTFGGTGTLAIGASGIRNEASATQEFNTPIRLAGSQNWEAENGNLRFNGNIDTAGYLLAIGGAKDSALAGIISGGGGLAKDGTGILTVTAVNTYTGPTFLHDGILRLGSGGNLPATALTFIAGNPAVLDLNGRDQTLGEVSSALGGTGKILLGGATLTTNALGDGSNSYLGSIEGSGSVIKSGTGVWTLAGTNSYSGETRLSSGVLRLSTPDALSANSNLVFSGGIVELAATDFSRTLGTGPGQAQFTGFGGFSAHGGTRIVNFGGNEATVTWGSGGFVPSNTAFRLSSTTSDATVEFRNNINLANGWQTFSVANGSAAIDGRITGSISNGGLVKSNSGILELGKANTYSGPTLIWGGGLLVTHNGALGSGNLSFGSSGGVLILGAGNFTRSLGTGSGQVQFTAAGGFAAYGANRVVNLGNDKSTVTWGQGGFIPAGQPFLLSAEGAATATIDFQNGIDLNGASRTFHVANGSSAVDATLSGVISNGGLIKSGEGTLQLTGTNTYSGQTQINGGALLISSEASLGTGNLLINGGVLMLKAASFLRSAGVADGQVQFTGNGGFAAFETDLSVNLGGGGAKLTWGTGAFVPSGSTFSLSNSSADRTVSVVNPIDLAAADRTINVDNGTAMVDARLEGIVSNGGLIKTGAGTLELVSPNSYTGATQIVGGALRVSSGVAISSSSNLVLAGGVIELAGGDFTRALGAGANQVRFVSSGGFSAAGANRNVNLGGAKTAITWNSTPGFLTYNQKLILSSESADATVDFQNPIILGTSSVGQREIDVKNGTATVDGKISGAITSPGATFGIKKTGAGTLELSAANSYSGITTVSEGVLLVTGELTASSRIEVERNGTFSYSGASALSRPILVEGGTFIYDSSSLFGGSLEFNSGYLAGSGNLGKTDVDISSGLTISPSGTLRTGSQVWDNGGVYSWEIASLSGTAGSTNGWDLLSIQGSLNFSADPGGFTIRISAQDILEGWNPTILQSWLIATSTGPSQGFTSVAPVFDSAGFSTKNDLAGGWFSLDQSGNSVHLVFTPVPEPSAAAMLGFAFIAVFRRKTKVMNSP